MVPNNSLISERIGILALLPPTTPTAVTSVVSSPYFSVLATNGNLFQRYLAVVQLSGVSNTNTISIGLYKASDTSGTGSATISALQTFTGTTSGIITNTASVMVTEFDVNGTAFDTSKPFLSIQVTGTVQSVAGMVIGEDGRYDPASSYNLTGTQVKSINAV